MPELESKRQLSDTQVHKAPAVSFQEVCVYSFVMGGGGDVWNKDCLHPGPPSALSLSSTLLFGDSQLVSFGFQGHTEVCSP